MIHIKHVTRNGSCRHLDLRRIFRMSKKFCDDLFCRGHLKNLTQVILKYTQTQILMARVGVTSNFVVPMENIIFHTQVK